VNPLYRAPESVPNFLPSTIKLFGHATDCIFLLTRIIYSDHVKISVGRTPHFRMLLLFSSKVRHGTPPKWITLLFWPIILSRFIVFAPSLYYKVYATNHHNVIKDHAQLYNGTYGTAVVTGERLADTWGSALFLYNIAAWMPTVLFIPPLHLPFTIAETVLTVFVSLATHHQTGYAPHNKKDCHNPMIFGMQPPPGANESFFAAAARLNATVSTPVQMCESFVKEWQFGMTVW